MNRYTLLFGLPPAAAVKSHRSEMVQVYKACCQILLRYALQNKELPRRLEAPVTLNLKYRFKNEQLAPRGRVLPVDDETCWAAVRPILEAMADMGIIGEPEEAQAGRIAVTHEEEEPALVVEIEAGP
jgi:hypothetical protein